MASGIIIHITVGTEKRTEFFTEERVSIGSDDTNDLQIHTNNLNGNGVWFELENSDGVYRITEFDPSLELQINEHRIRRFIAITDGDRIDIPNTDISFTFFSLTARSALITTNRETVPVAQFIEEAALEARTSPKRDDAKAFLREFTRELLREVSWTTKAIVFVLAAAFIYGLVYVGYSVSRELRQSRETTEQQSEVIRKLEQQLGQTSDQIGSLEKTNSDLIKTVSLAPNLRVAYGNGVCLIVGVYDLVDKKSGQVLRYPDQSSQGPNTYEPGSSGEDNPSPSPQPATSLTTEGNGSPVEYDFIGTGFHVGSGYIVTNRHVVQPWTEDDNVKQMLRDNDGRAKVKRLVVYFPNYPQPFQLRIANVGTREDLAVGTIDSSQLPADLPALPLDYDTEAVAIGKTVVTMGYPSGPDRLLAMVDDDEAKSINQRFGNSRQNLINFLAQSKKIVPLTTQGAITDLDSHRIVHDAKTAEGGSGAPLFGQSGKVIGVNFGVFTENTAANMAVPVKYAIDLLTKSGWKSPEQAATDQNKAANTNANTATGQSRSQQ
ncbi:MAG TPA: trypsin-like peptidase domain-containing protein [Pyrinomonadaceae bacterium]|nr:trypsin-like peptidase domain-containing protein [Pyrinomonadaceae bacterium]